MIYILEGPDGTGKTTLANEIAEQKKASVIHSYFDPKWDIKKHHMDMWQAAQIVSRWRPVVLDRWAISELVYGTVFRGKPGYEVPGLLWEMGDEFDNVVWIYCRNDNAVENHLKNMEKRNEMFNDMKEVVTMFDEIVKNPDLSTELGIKWIEYDFDKVDMKEFVKELPGENFVD